MKISVIVISLLFSTPILKAQEADPCQQMRNAEFKINVIIGNILNIDTTDDGNGEPYKKKTVECRDTICAVTESSEFQSRYLPHHPDANKDGYVSFPDINLMQQQSAMIQVARENEAAVKSCISSLW